MRGRSHGRIKRGSRQTVQALDSAFAPSPRSPNRVTMVRVNRLPDSLVIENAELRNRTGVFRDRVRAGRVLAKMLGEYSGSDAQVMAVPAGAELCALTICCTATKAAKATAAPNAIIKWREVL